MKFDVHKLLESSARISGAVSFASCLFLFFPSNVLPFDILKFRSDNGIWIFAVLAVSVSIWGSFFVKWMVNLTKKKLEKRSIWMNYEYILKGLSVEEKKFIKEYYDKKETAIILNPQNPIHKRLETFQVISISAGTNIGSINGIPGFIQPWVFELIDKQPKYLRIIEADEPNVR